MVNEPTHKKKDVSATRLMILQMRLRSHPMGPDLDSLSTASFGSVYYVILCLCDKYTFSHGPVQTGFSLLRFSCFQTGYYEILMFNLLIFLFKTMHAHAICINIMHKSFC